MSRYIFHPVSGLYVELDSILDKDLFIENRLFKPEAWQMFHFDEVDELNKTYGIEIELNTSIDSEKNPKGRIDICRQLLALLNRDGKHFHIMRDNSVRNGIELVSAPMTFKYWIQKFNVKEINDLFDRLKLSATIDTGLHIHVGVTHTRRIREVYLQLFAISYPMWIHVTDRRFERLQERYVSTNYFVEKAELKTRYKATIESLIKTGTSKVDYEWLGYYDYHVEDRYLGLNFFNEKTIEFRMFAGTNDVFDIYKYLTFVHIITKLVDEISETRINDVFTLEDFVKRTQSEVMLEETVKYIRFINLMENKDRIYDNHFMFLDAYWYRVSINNVKRKELALKKDVYKEYLEIIKKIDKKNPEHNCSENQNLKKDIDLLLLNEVYEVVHTDDNIISMASIRGSTGYICLNKNQANSEYVFLRGVSRHFILENL